MNASTLPTRPLRRVENTLRQLLNDMHTVAEARCAEHGVGGGTTANSAAALLPCIGVEIIAERTRLGESKDQSIRRVWSEIDSLVNYPPYRSVGFAVFKLCRNGLAHGFYPNDVEVANGSKASVKVSFWIDGTTHRSVCVDSLGDRAASEHLTHRALGSGLRVLNVSAQHLYVDVRAYIEHFLQRLRADAALQARVAERDERLLSTATERATKSLTKGDLNALGVPQSIATAAQ